MGNQIYNLKDIKVNILQDKYHYIRSNQKHKSDKQVQIYMKYNEPGKQCIYVLSYFYTNPNSKQVRIVQYLTIQNMEIGNFYNIFLLVNMQNK